VKESFKGLKDCVNNYFAGKDAFYICVATAGVSITGVYVVQAFRNRECESS
jgi:hypothetical protein